MKRLVFINNDSVRYYLLKLLSIKSNNGLYLISTFHSATCLSRRKTTINFAASSRWDVMTLLHQKQARIIHLFNLSLSQPIFVLLLPTGLLSAWEVLFYACDKLQNLLNIFFQGEAVFFTTKRGKLGVKYNNSIYHKNYEGTNGLITWTCSFKKCRSRIRTRGLEFVSSVGTHKHNEET